MFIGHQELLQRQQLILKVFVIDVTNSITAPTPTPLPSSLAKLEHCQVNPKYANIFTNILHDARIFYNSLA